MPVIIPAGGSTTFATPTNGVSSTASAGVATTAVRSDATFKIPLVLAGLIPIIGGRFVRIQGVNLNTGNNNLYTAPANTRTLILGSWALYVDGVAAVTSQPYIQFLGAGTRYPICTLNSALGAGSASAITASGFVLEPTDVLGITTSVTNGINVQLVGIEFPSSIPVKTAWVKDPASGDNTLYTCPAATNSFVLSASTVPVFAGQSISIVNGSGGSLNYYYNVVPTGSSAGVTNQLTAAAAIAGVTVTRTNLGTASGITLNAGDFINVNGSGANTGGIAWATVAEIAGA